MIFYSVQKCYYDDKAFYQVLPYSFWESFKLEKTLKDKINFLRNGSFKKNKAKHIADMKNLEEFNKMKKNKE